MSRRTGALLLALAAGTILFAALASEWWGGLVPCVLCLWQRWPYRVALAFGAVALLLPRFASLALAGLALSFAAAAALAGLHVGVEQGWWPSPFPACAAPASAGPTTIDEMLRNLAPVPAKPCDAPTYLIPAVPVSMALMNLVLASFLLAASLSLFRPRRRPA